MRRRRRDLDRMVDALLAGEPLPSGRLEPEDVEALRTAIELRAARPGADQPDEDFVTDLRRRLSTASAPEREIAGGPSRIPRRAVLAGAAGAVAAGVVGAVAERTLTSTAPARPAATGEIVPASGEWVPVAAEPEVAGGHVTRFVTASTIGFVSERNGTLSAVSGACSHQGCLLRFNQAAQRLDCPCHRTAFGVDGKVLFSQLLTPPATLPQIQVRRRQGQVEAFLPREA